ncbi:MAG: Cytochrome c family protein [Acidobacteria bacterium]|nr:Cytochrome c family protein [Acidobacteriota bacterium]
MTVICRMSLAMLLVATLSCRGKMPETATATAPSATTSASTTSTAVTAAQTTTTSPCGFTTTGGGPSQIPPVATSGNIPLYVPLPSVVNSQVQIRPYFDWFSWEEFIALNWPASTKGRGNADQPSNASVFKNAKNGSQTVWGTWKANWELFNQGSTRPSPFDSWDVKIPAQCSAAKPGQRELVMSSKGNTVLNDGVQAFSFPLVDANSNYLLYEVRYNRAAYEFMRGTDANQKSWLYLAKNLSPPTQQTMPMSTAAAAHPGEQDQLGAMMLKAAWRDMTGVPASERNRYYVVEAQVYNPETQQCTAKDVGLVGLHIVQKLQDFPEWVWSTFEQVDVLTSPQHPGLLPACTTTDCSQVHGFANRPQTTTLDPNPANRTPVPAARINAIPTTPPGQSTVDANMMFQQSLAGTVWANYQLVVTQWPFNAGNFKPPENRGTYPCGAGAPFPETGAVNVTMETYFQSANDAVGAGGNSCMSCHYNAALYDFSWGLKRRPHA